MLALLVAAATIAVGAPAASAIDVNTPEAGITDPLAGVAPLDRNCKPGQVDVNTASALEIGEAFRIASRPTLERVIAMRPWLKPLDLVSVPGVPPSAAAGLMSKGCATPTELPMPTPLACKTRSPAIDIQSASAAAIARGLKLPQSVAERLVQARPLPQDLHQVLTPRVAGLAEPKLDELLADERLCVTPAVFTFAGATWRWASEEHGAVVGAAYDDRYALIVPANVVAGPTGAWGRITPDRESMLPRTDMHIYGSWDGEVGSRLPDPVGDRAQPPAVRPVMQHELANGMASFSWGDSVASEAGGTVVAPLTSLSVTVAYDLSPLCSRQFVVQRVGYDDGSLFCSSDSPRDTSQAALLHRRAEFAGRYVASAPVPGPCGTVGRAVSSGGLPVSLVCSTDIAGDKATWTIENASGVQILAGVLTSFGTVIHRVPRGNDAYETGSVHVDDRLYGLVGEALARWLVANVDVVLPGTGVGISKRSGSGPSTFHHSVSMDEWKQYWTLFQLLDVIDAGLELAGVRSFSVAEIANCLENVVHNGTPDLGDIMGCLEVFADLKLALYEQLARNGGNARVASQIAGLRLVLKRILLAPTLTDFGSSYIVQAHAALKGSDDITLEFLPPPPLVEPGDGTFIARTARREGFLVDPQRTIALPIRTGGDFLCYASTRFVIDLVTKFRAQSDIEYLQLDPQIPVSQLDAPPCTPPEPPLRPWTYTPPPDGNTPFSVIFRGVEGDGITRSYLINSRGEIQHIPDGGTYQCLVLFNPVIWNVPSDKIEAWRPVGGPASCG